MSENTKRLLELINQQKTINEISDILGISHKKIFNYLTMIRNKGFDFDRKYYDTGDIMYVPRKSVVNKTQNGVNVITDKDSTSYTALVISDTHLGSGFEIQGVMDKVYNFCASEGIHNILFTGDILDGTYNKISPKISDPYEQIEYFLKIYPFDKNILTFSVLGDHDYSILRITGQDFSKVLDSYRHDIVHLGYGYGYLNIKDDSIGLRHSIKGVSGGSFDDGNLMFLGHTHNFKMSPSSKKNVIYVPSLSNLCLYKQGYEGLPSLLLVKLNFNNDVICSAYINQLVVLDKIYFVNETYLSMSSSKKGSFDNTEDFSKVLKK